MADVEQAALIKSARRIESSSRFSPLIEHDLRANAFRVCSPRENRYALFRIML
jgi:hypothetical protein